MTEAALAVAAACTPEEVLRIAAEQACALVGARLARLYPLTGQDQTGLPTELGALERPVRLTQAELEAHPAWAEGMETLAGLPLQGWLSAPMLGRKGRRVGFLLLSDKEAGDFTAEDEATIALLARAAGLALEGAEELRQEQLGRKQLAANEERLRALLASHKQALWVTNAEGAIEQECPSWGALAGQSFEEYRGWGWLSAIHPEDQARVAEAWSGMLARPGLYDCEYRLRRRDSSERTTVARALPVYDPEGTVRCWVGISFDLSEEHERLRRLEQEQSARVAAEAAERRAAFLAEASQVLASSLELKSTLAALARLSVPALADWCFVDVLEGGQVYRVHVVQADPAFEELAHAIQGLFPLPVDLMTHHPSMVALRHGRSVLVEEVTEAWRQYVAPNPQHLEAMQAVDFRSVIAVPLIARGHTLGALTFLSSQPGRRYGQEDVTMAQQLVDRAALALDNARLYREAQEAVRVREEFLSIASHELRTPLTPLQLKLSALRRDAERPGIDALPSSRVAAAVGVLERQVHRLAALVDELLDVTRISGGRLSLRLEELDLAELLQEVVERLMPTARQAGCVVHVQAPSGTKGEWDRLRLEQVVTNLLTNALKYGAGRPVRVGLSRDREQACLSVEDAGIGISPEHQARIFGLFERAVSDRHYGGLGLGLYITQRIVAAHGGQILVSSALGEGSRFEVRLPLRSAAREGR